MKKDFNYWYLFLLILPAIFIGIIGCNKKPEKIVIITEKEAHIGIGDESATIEIPCYIAERFSFLLEKKQIRSCNLVDKKLSTNFVMEIDKITNENNYIKYDNEKLIGKKLHLKYNYLSTDMLKIPNACIELNYENESKYILDIGSVTLIRGNELNYVNLENIKGIVNDIIPLNNSYIPSTVGLVVKLHSSEKRVIKKIELLNGYGEIDNSKIMKLNTFDIDNQTDINKFIKYELMIKDSDSKCNITVDNNIILLLPICYYELEAICSAGLLITYEQGEKQIINEFPIFSSTTVSNSYCKYVFNPN